MPTSVTLAQGFGKGTWQLLLLNTIVSCRCQVPCDFFVDSLFSDIDSLLLTAGVHPQHFGYHRLLARRFPFSVYYKVDHQLVKVYAVLDNRSSPAWTREVLQR